MHIVLLGGFLIVFVGVVVEDLLKYLDPQFTDHITVPDAMKLEFILAGKRKKMESLLIEGFHNIYFVNECLFVED